MFLSGMMAELTAKSTDNPEEILGNYTGEVNAVVTLLGIDETFDGITIEVKESATTANYSLVIAEMDLGNGSFLPEYELDDVIVTPSGAGYTVAKSGSITVVIPEVVVPPFPPFFPEGTTLYDVPATITLENGYIENNILDLEIKAVATLMGIIPVTVNIYFEGTKEAPSVFSVSGVVLFNDISIEGITISYLNTSTVTTGNGYSIEVPAGTDLTITPSFEDYIFEPESITILDISENHQGQNFIIVEDPVYYVSGIVTLPTGNSLEGVTISYLDTYTVSTANGYFIEVPEGTNLTLTPSLEGYTFEPESITILDINENHYQQNFLAIEDIEDPVYYVSGIVSLATGNTLEGVTISYLDTYTVTTANGYFIEVPGGTNLTLTPSLEGYTFEPESITILDINENHYQQNFLAIESYTIQGTISCGNSGLENMKQVQLFKLGYNQMYDMIDEQIIGEGYNEYSFFDISAGSYLVKARTANCGMPTYFGDVLEWRDAEIITFPNNNNIFNANINIIETPSIGIGNSVMNGNVARESVEKFSITIPVIDEIVYLQYLEADEWTTVLATITDINGFYEFSDIPAGKYILFLDIPGLDMINLIEFDLDENETLSGINFIITDEGIETKDETSSIEPISQNSKLQVYPNPTTGLLSVVSSQLSENRIHPNVIEISDIAGRVVHNVACTENRATVKIDISHLPAGVYFLRIGNETVKVVKN